MKFFHLSDLHIGLKLIERDLREDQEYIFEQIIRLAKEQQPDAMVIAGDIYDKAVPSAEAVEIFDSFMKNLSEEMPQMPVNNVEYEGPSRCNPPGRNEPYGYFLSQ
mgnify:CR=1 FL=1